MKRSFSLVFAVVLAGCGGNYSNEDIDFQLAVPDQQEIAVRLPAQTIDVPDAAEYYTKTREVVRGFNAIADALLSLIDNVRAYPPSERQPNHRVWGPFPNETHPGWQTRLVIDRDAAALAGFSYSVEVRSTGPWIPLISGAVESTGGVRRGKGQLILATGAARAAGYPLDSLDGWASLRIDYDNGAFPITSMMTLDDHPTNQRFVYQYREESDGSGSMAFDFPTPQFSPVATLARISSRWLASGAGRGDFQVLEGSRARARGVDCWGPDTRATYVQRELDPKRDMGSADSCVLR